MYFKNMGSSESKSNSNSYFKRKLLKKELEDDYKIYSANDNGYVGHEFIIDLREFKHLGIQEKDIAKDSWIIVFILRQCLGLLGKYND